MTRVRFDQLNEDLLQNILSKLPAPSFASAACVSRSWWLACNRVLSRPKLASALSLNPSSCAAAKEVLDKVLSEPIRPHFAIACVVCPKLELGPVHLLITQKLGSRTPVITCSATGIIGRDALTGEFKEVLPEVNDRDDNRRVVLIVGFLPGVKVDAIPLSQPLEHHSAPLVDKFVMDIKDFAISVTHCGSPDAIIIFGASSVDMKPVLDSLDRGLSKETAIVGDPNCDFLYRAGNHTGNVCSSLEYASEVVALVFANDRKKAHGIGETQFYCDSSSGLSPVGPLYRAASVRTINSSQSWITAKRTGSNVVLDGQSMLDDIDDELGNEPAWPALYIGVLERRRCRAGSKKGKGKAVISVAFHEVIGGDEQYLYVDGVDIRTVDAFKFYCPDYNAASSSCHKVSNNLRGYVADRAGDSDESNKREVVGGLIFACCGRGQPFFGSESCDVDSSPLTENFPGVPIGGKYCLGEIHRYSSSCGLVGELARYDQLVYSTVYLLMSYIPPPSGL